MSAFAVMVASCALTNLTGTAGEKEEKPTNQKVFLLDRAEQKEE